MKTESLREVKDNLSKVIEVALGTSSCPKASPAISTRSAVILRSSFGTSRRLRRPLPRRATGSRTSVPRACTRSLLLGRVFPETTGGYHCRVLRHFAS